MKKYKDITIHDVTGFMLTNVFNVTMMINGSVSTDVVSYKFNEEGITFEAEKVKIEMSKDNITTMSSKDDIVIFDNSNNTKVILRVKDKEYINTFKEMSIFKGTGIFN